MSALLDAALQLANAERATWGEREIVRFTLPWGKSPTDGVFCAIGDDAYELRATNGFDEALARAALELAIGADTTPGVVRVVFGELPSCDGVAVLAPADSPFHRGHEVLEHRSRWVVPIHACELPDGLAVKDFDALRGKSAQLKVFDWARRAQPLCRVRLSTEWPGGPFRKTKNAFLVSPSSVSSSLLSLPVACSVELFDVAERAFRITARLDDVELRAGDDARDIPRDALASSLAALLRGAELAAIEVDPRSAPRFECYLFDPKKRRTIPTDRLAIRTLEAAQRELEVLTPSVESYVGFVRDGVRVQFCYDATDGPLVLDVPRPAERVSLRAPTTIEDAQRLLARIVETGPRAIEELAFPGTMRG